MATRTNAADRMIDGIIETWDSRDQYVLTAEHGLSEPDEEVLRSYCEETGDDYERAEREVLDWVANTGLHGKA